MKATTVTSIALLALFSLASAASSGCKRAEKKREGQSASTDSAKPAPASATDPSAISNPHAAPGEPTNPHAPNAKMPVAPPPPASAQVKPTAADGSKVIGPFSITVPKGWTEMPPSGSMRLAQWKIGGKDEGSAGELVLYNFGGGGSVDANIDRWVGQFTQDDGSSSKEKAVRKDETIGGLPVTTLSLSGRYVAAVQPGAATKHDTPSYKMLAAIVTVGSSAYFFKMLGPKTTLDAADKDWAQMIKSIKKL